MKRQIKLGSRNLDAIRKSRTFDEEFDIALASLEIVDEFEVYLAMPLDWLERRKGHLRNMHEHFGNAIFPATRLMQGEYPVPIQLTADVLTSNYDDFAYLDKIYAYYDDDEKKPEFKTTGEEEDWYLQKLGVLHRFLVYDYLCVLNFGKPYKILVADAVNGSREQLMQVLQADKTFALTPWCSERIREAQYRGDWDFLERIGKAIAKKPELEDRYMFKAVLLVARFWEEKFREMPYPEIVTFMEKKDVLRKGTDVENFRKVLNRNGLKKEQYNRKVGRKGK